MLSPRVNPRKLECSGQSEGGNRRGIVGAPCVLLRGRRICTSFMFHPAHRSMLSKFASGMFAAIILEMLPNYLDNCWSFSWIIYQQLDDEVVKFCRWMRRSAVISTICHSVCKLYVSLCRKCLVSIEKSTTPRIQRSEGGPSYCL